MFKAGDIIQLSASDLVGHLNCRHLTNLDLQAANGRLQPPFYDDPLLEVLAERGARHERSFVEHLAAAGLEVETVEGNGVLPGQIDQTLAAMRAGRAVIVQGALRHGVFGGRVDVLRRVERPSALGDWSYEAIDTKLARETRSGTVLQLSLYSDLVARVQETTPEFMYVVTPGANFAPETYRTADFAAYYRYVRNRLERSVAVPDRIAYPDPKEHCDVCRWRMSCDERRHRDDHLCLVAGITRIQTVELQGRGITTVVALAEVPIPLTWTPDRGAKPSYERSREQARVQVEGRGPQGLVYEPLAPTAGIGLCRLPAPSPGDIFFDLEGDPFVDTGGLEYLFGYVILQADGAPAYVGEWAIAREAERLAFVQFVDFVMARWGQYPDMHIYHYGGYETGALKRLMGRYALREDEIDRMLRGELFVDLLAVVRHGVRASVESYTIKNLEVFYGYERGVPLPEARKALAHLQGCLELDAVADISDEARTIVEGYNRDDCVSTLRLRDWLEEIRAELVRNGANIQRPPAQAPEPSEGVDAHQQALLGLVARLIPDVPPDVTARSPEQQGRWILANILDWHRREQKSVWWEYFRLAELPAEDLLMERDAVAGLAFVQGAGGTARAPVHRYRFPPQELELRGGESLHTFGGVKLGKVQAVSLDERTIDIKKRQDTAQVHPEGAFAHDVVPGTVMADALFRIGEFVAASGIEASGPYQAARDLLLRRAPRVTGPLKREGETAVQAAVRLAPALSGGVLAIQGPPGAGKTFTGARMICALVQAGKRVGISGNSHKVIRVLLDAVVAAARELAIPVRCIQKPAEPQDDLPHLSFCTSNEALLEALQGTHQVAGATAWFWSRPDAFQAVDVLFVDEAAQMSLANVLAVSQAGQSLVLLGDPRQLEQPGTGSHPEGTDVSALDHLFAGKATIGGEEGLFLEETWRLHPEICAFTSELFYEGRLHSRAGLERLRVNTRGRVNGSGLRFLPVEHTGNQSSSLEEAIQIDNLVKEILRPGSSWVNRDGAENPLTLEDILIIAPYNAQVFELKARIPGARIGTVDKFQGQEAAIVIYSMTTSSSADAPHGMEFLYSLNRLNVATSRAMCVCVLVGSPVLFEPECRTPRQIHMANAFCRYLERATVLDA